jgi:hypothetical protein
MSTYLTTYRNTRPRLFGGATIGGLALLLALTSGSALALKKERWTSDTPEAAFFNDYDPNFYTGFAPRVQDRRYVTIHPGRGNQLRVRMVLPEEAILEYLPNQVARHALYKEVIDGGIITLTANSAWEAYDAKVQEVGLAALAAERDTMDPAAWRERNLEIMDQLNPRRLYRIQRDFNVLAEGLAGALRETATEELEAPATRLDLLNDLMPGRILVTELDEEQNAAFDALVPLAQAKDQSGFRTALEPLFAAITQGIYPIVDGKLDFYEFTSIYPMGTYDALTTYEGRKIPKFVTTGVWTLIPREHGSGYTGMVDYISNKGYYGVMPMLPYQYAGGAAYNAFHNPGISNWIQGHPLLPASWKEYKVGSREDKPYLRASLTSRGPVSHGCTRMSSGHLVEFREMLPSTSEGMQGIRAFMPLSQCFDVYDIDGDGTEEVMGVQYYFAFRANKSRSANQIWAQNNREDFLGWLYGDTIVMGPPGEVIVKAPISCRFVGRKVEEGKRYPDLKLFEAPYEPELLQFYQVKGVDTYSRKAMDFNREMRRVGYGHDIDRATLLLE